MACERRRLMKARKRQRELIIIFFSLLFSFQLLLFLCCQSGRWWYHHSGPLSGPDNEQRRKVMKRRKKRTHRIIEILPYIYIFFFSSFFPYRLWFRLKFPQNCDGNCFNFKKWFTLTCRWRTNPLDFNCKKDDNFLFKSKLFRLILFGGELISFCLKFQKFPAFCDLQQLFLQETHFDNPMAWHGHWHTLICRSQGKRSDCTKKCDNFCCEVGA